MIDNNKSDEESLLPCPCCGSLELTEAGAYEICRVCGWEDDPVQSSDPDFAGGANNDSLNEFWRKWLGDQKSGK